MLFYLKVIYIIKRPTNLWEDWNSACGAKDKQYVCAGKQGLLIKKFDSEALNLPKLPVMNNKIF